VGGTAEADIVQEGQNSDCFRSVSIRNNLGEGGRTATDRNMRAEIHIYSLPAYGIPVIHPQATPPHEPQHKHQRANKPPPPPTTTLATNNKHLLYFRTDGQEENTTEGERHGGTCENIGTR